MSHAIPAIPVSLCADDFGIEPGVDEAITELSQKGRLSATSCLTTATGFSERADWLKSLPIDLGVHLNFTEFLGIQGLYLPLPKLILQSYLRKLDPAEVHSQICRQLDAFEHQCGRVPDFVDGHLHVHQLPMIRQILIQELLQRYPSQLPWLRNTRPGHLSGAMPFKQRLKAHIIGALGARSLTRMAGQHGFLVNTDFLGAYDFSGPHPSYAAMLDLWFSAMRPGSLLMTHPASHITSSDAFGQGRVEEYRVLSSELFTLLLEQHHLVVTRLSARAHIPSVT